MRTPLIAGNWKMYKTPTEAALFVGEFKKRIRGVSGREVLLCPAGPAIPATVRAVGKTKILVGGQNLYFLDEGAFTGEMSAAMLTDAGATFVIIGHSERRQYFGETNASCNAKVRQALARGLTPVYCIGEVLAEREGNKTMMVLNAQLREGLKEIPKAKASGIVIAYEPVWAIGTGKTATPEIAQEAHAYIRDVLADLFGKTVANRIRILYGGSVKPDNVDELMGQKDIDGALVGGASLDPESFARIVKFR